MKATSYFTLLLIVFLVAISIDKKGTTAISVTPLQTSLHDWFFTKMVYVVELYNSTTPEQRYLDARNESHRRRLLAEEAARQTHQR